MQTSKLCVHIQDSVNIPAQVEVQRRGQPRVAKQMADEPDNIRACKEVSPDTFWVGRVHYEEDDQDVSDPHGAAVMIRDRILRRAMCRDADAWESFNEPNQWEHIKQSEYECWFSELMHAEELKTVIYNWSVGNPRLEIWHDPIVLEALRLCDYLGLHEYLAPSLWDKRAFDPPYTDREDYLMNGWFLFRYRKVWEIISQYLEPEARPPIIITEFGIDSGACHWDPGAQGGWKSFFGREELPALFEQIDWADRQMQRDDYIMGACWFNFGTRDQHNWGTFDFFDPPEAREAFTQYLEARLQPEDLFTMIGDHLNDPDIMIPANLEAAMQQYALYNYLGAARTREVGYNSEFVFEGERYLAQMFMPNDDLSTQHIVYASLDDPRPWSEKLAHFDREN